MNTKKTKIKSHNYSAKSGQNHVWSTVDSMYQEVSLTKNLQLKEMFNLYKQQQTH